MAELSYSLSPEPDGVDENSLVLSPGKPSGPDGVNENSIALSPGTPSRPSHRPVTHSQLITHLFQNQDEEDDLMNSGSSDIEALSPDSMNKQELNHGEQKASSGVESDEDLARRLQEEFNKEAGISNQTAPTGRHLSGKGEQPMDKSDMGGDDFGSPDYEPEDNPSEQRTSSGYDWFEPPKNQQRSPTANNQITRDHPSISSPYLPTLAKYPMAPPPLPLLVLRKTCDTCINKRIKCSNTHPTCVDCTRKGLPCHYSPDISARDLHIARGEINVVDMDDKDIMDHIKEVSTRPVGKKRTMEENIALLKRMRGDMEVAAVKVKEAKTVGEDEGEEGEVH